jgi:hypothetical protein
MWPPMAETFLYVAQMSDLKLVKIGIASNPAYAAIAITIIGNQSRSRHQYSGSTKSPLRPQRQP